MHDAAARRLVRDLIDALEAIDRDYVLARRRLRDWSAAGYPSGVGESHIGSDRHSDPTVRAVIDAEIRAGRALDAPRVGWRDRDPDGTKLRELDQSVRQLVSCAQEIAADLADILRVAERGRGEDGCALCAAVRYLPDRHACDPECARRDHHPRNSQQPIYSRTAPRAHVRVHPCVPPRSAVLVDGRHEVPIASTTRDTVLTVWERPKGTDKREFGVAEHPPAGARPLARVTVLAYSDAIRPRDVTPLGVPDRPRCSWHWEFAERYGVDAADPITLWHLEHPGARTPTTLIREHHPHDFARVHSGEPARAG